MTGYYAFNAGLAATLPAAHRATVEDMLADVQGQESRIRADTTEWLVTYMVLAYGPLSDEDMAAYTAFTASDGGKALNAALFTAFDAAFTPVLDSLGREAGRMVSGQDI